MRASTPQFTFTVWDLVDDHPDVARRDLGWTSYNVDVWRGSSPASDAGQGVLVRSYDPASLMQARDQKQPPDGASFGVWSGYGLMNMTNLAISELIHFPEVKETLHVQRQRPEPYDTVMLIDGACVPSVMWELHVGGMSATISASLLTHPVSVITWRGRLTTPITLRALDLNA
jgi:hypothetical protein